MALSWRTLYSLYNGILRKSLFIVSRATPVSIIYNAILNVIIKKLIERNLFNNHSKNYFYLTGKVKILPSFSVRPYYYNFQKNNNKAIIDD